MKRVGIRFVTECGLVLTKSQLVAIYFEQSRKWPVRPEAPGLDDLEQAVQDFVVQIVADATGNMDAGAMKAVDVNGWFATESRISDLFKF